MKSRKWKNRFFFSIFPFAHFVTVHIRGKSLEWKVSNEVTIFQLDSSISFGVGGGKLDSSSIDLLVLSVAAYATSLRKARRLIIQSLFAETLLN